MEVGGAGGNGDGATGIDVHGTTTDDHILIDGVSVFDTYVNGYLDQHNFALSEPLNTGDTIDFAVGTGGNGYSFDSTGLSASISVPEPASVSLLGLPILAIRRRRK